jgi:ABC-type multidrug transport system ATPase subunit
VKPHDDGTGLQVRSLGRSFGPHRLIADATFDVAPGEIVCLTGDNGVGKSTLLRCLMGLAGYEGDASLDGVSLRRHEALARVSYVPQSPALVETASVEETLDFFASLRRIRFDQSVVPAGFLPPLEARIGSLSGGQRQRVALVVGLLARARLLLLDEPMANLDDGGRELVRHMVGRAAANGSVVVIVSPAAADLTSLVTRVLTLADGHVLDDDGLLRRLRDDIESDITPRSQRLEVPA